MKFYTKHDPRFYDQRLYKGGGGGGSSYYANLESLYGEQAQTSRELRAESQKTFGDMDGLRNEARGFGSLANRDMAAANAGADFQTAANANLRGMTEDLSSMGINPGDERYMRQMRTTQVQNTAGMAAAKTGARQAQADRGFARMQDVASMGLGLPSQATSAASSAGNMMSSAQNMRQQQDAQTSANVAGAVRGGIDLYGILAAKDGGYIQKPLRLAQGGLVQRLAAGGVVGRLRSDMDTPMDAEGGVGGGGAMSGPLPMIPGPTGGAVMTRSVFPRLTRTFESIGGSDADAGPGAGGDSGDSGVGDAASAGVGGGGYADGGYVRGYAQGGVVNALRGIQAPPPPNQPPPNPQANYAGDVGKVMYKNGDKIATNVGKGIESVGNATGSQGAQAFGQGMQGIDPQTAAQMANMQVDNAAASIPGMTSGAEAAGSSAMADSTAAALEAAGATSSEAAIAGSELAATAGAQAGVEAAATTASTGLMGGMGAAGMAIGTAIPWVGAALAVGSALDLFADGGEVEGPGGPKDDLIPAMLSDGEFVMPVGAVKYFGLDRLEKMRQKGLEFEKQLGIQG